MKKVKKGLTPYACKKIYYEGKKYIECLRHSPEFVDDILNEKSMKKLVNKYEVSISTIRRIRIENSRINHLYTFRIKEGEFKLIDKVKSNVVLEKTFGKKASSLADGYYENILGYEYNNVVYVYWKEE